MEQPAHLTENDLPSRATRVYEPRFPDLIYLSLPKEPSEVVFIASSSSSSGSEMTL